MAEELKVLIQQVEYVLSVHEPARNNDKALVWRVWMEYYGVGYSISYSRFEDLPSSDIITRCRRIIQNERGLYPPTNPEVLKERQKHIKEVKEQLQEVREETNEIVSARNEKVAVSESQIKMF